MKTIYRDIVSAIILSKDNKLLMVQKNPAQGGVYLGFWLIPGGGVEPGESQEGALRREISEELQLDTSSYPLTLVKGDHTGESEKLMKGEKVLCKMHFFCYKIVIADRLAADIEITLDAEHRTYRWFDLDEIIESEISPPSRELFRDLGWI